MATETEQQQVGEQPLSEMTASTFLEHLISLGREGFAFDVEDLEALRDKLAHDGDLTRWILDALELGADDPSNAEASRTQRRIEAALKGWFTPDEDREPSPSPSTQPNKETS